MIAHLSGTLLAKHATSVVVDVGGVGYEVTIPVTTFYGMEEPGSPIQLRIYTHVREDALQLFGFRTVRERELFKLLISVSGVGPQSAIGILSLSADEIIAAIRSNNLARLRRGTGEPFGPGGSGSVGRIAASARRSRRSTIGRTDHRRTAAGRRTETASERRTARRRDQHRHRRR